MVYRFDAFVFVDVGEPAQMSYDEARQRVAYINCYVNNARAYIALMDRTRSEGPPAFHTQLGSVEVLPDDSMGP